jgi:glycosyltransferase involved in cell wall biosynthesis
MIALSQSLRWMARCQRAKLRDRRCYSASVQIAAGLPRLLGSVFLRDSSRRLAALASARRTLPPLGWGWLTQTKMIRVAPSPDARANPWWAWLARRIGWDGYAIRSMEGRPTLGHGSILKPPVSDRERAVLLVSVEYNLAALLSSSRMEKILRNFRMVFSTSWSPPDFSPIWALSGEPGAEFCFIPSNPKDEELINGIAQPLTILPFFASHWIADDPNDPPIDRAERTYDLCVVGNWAPFKRHWLLFQALKSLPANLKIALIRQPEPGYTLEHIRELAAVFGIVPEIEWFNRLPAEEVRKIQADYRIGLMLSKREGSCLAIAESRLADSPAGVLRGAQIGSREFSNEEPGMLLREKRLVEDRATQMGAAAGPFWPGEWALQKIGATASSCRLKYILRNLAESKGEEWTVRINAFCFRSAVPWFLNAVCAIEKDPWHFAFEKDYDLGFIAASLRSIPGVESAIQTLPVEASG